MRCAVVFALALLSPGGLLAASFDCGKARSAHEKLICSNAELDAADTKLGQAYRAASRSFPVPGFIQATQQLFLVRYRQCANSKDKAAAVGGCLEEVAGRVRELEEAVAAKVYVTPGRTGKYDAEDIVLQVVQRNDMRLLRHFGAWMPNASDPRPFPEGQLCNADIELKAVAGNWMPADPKLRITVAEAEIRIEEPIPCTPRNMLSGTFVRIAK